MTARRRHFAFFTFPRFGHVRPLLPVMTQLVERGHRVSCLVCDEYADAVAATGAATLRYRSDFPAVVPAVDTVDEISVAAAAFVRETFAPLPTAWDAFADDAVDVVVDDAATMGASRLVARRAGCPLVRTYAGLAGNDAVPLNGTQAEPGDPEIDPAHPELVSVVESLPVMLRELGIDPETAGGPDVAEPELNLVFIPRSFQPQAELFDDSYVFVGPAATPPATQCWQPPADRRVALISLGTSSHNPGFFDACADAFADTGWHLVMTTTAPGDAAGRPDVEVHRFLDYAAVLPHAQVQVCQPGTGTLMDAFAHGVPVVTVPQQPDSYPIARRVGELGLGTVLLDEVTGDAVRDAVRSATGDRAMAERVRAMRDDIRRSGGTDRAVEVLEALT